MALLKCGVLPGLRRAHLASTVVARSQSFRTTAWTWMTLPYKFTELPEGMRDLAQKRRQKMKLMTPEEFFIAGVTFEDRQRRIKQLSKNQPIVFVKEPHPKDENAVHIYSLSYHDLGYVPRTKTHLFTSDTCYGHAISVGAAKDTQDHYGVKVGVVPSQPGLTITPLPSAVSEKYRDGLERLVAPGTADAVIKSQGGVCAITGVSADEVPLTLIPRWVVDPKAMELELRSVMAVCDPVAQASRLTEVEEPSPAFENLKIFTQAVNDWSDNDFEEYWMYLSLLARNMRKQGNAWKVKVTAPQLTPQS